MKILKAIREYFFNWIMVVALIFWLTILHLVVFVSGLISAFIHRTAWWYNIVDTYSNIGDKMRATVNKEKKECDDDGPDAEQPESAG